MKILTGYATRLNRERKFRELEIFKRLSSAKSELVRGVGRSPCLSFDSFRPSDGGEHLCFVMKLFLSNVQGAGQMLFCSDRGANVETLVARHRAFAQCGIATL